MRSRFGNGMAVEGDAEHVEHLAFIPVGRRPDPGRGRHGKRPDGQSCLEPEVGIGLEGEEVIDDGEIALRLPPRLLLHRSSIAVRS